MAVVNPIQNSREKASDSSSKGSTKRAVRIQRGELAGLWALPDTIRAVAKIWITYAWKDNDLGDIDYLVQELRRSGLEVKLDRWHLGAGKRLWSQIEHFITTHTESDAWLFFATQSSLLSEACREELAYALDRALSSRGETFPVIGLFPASVDRDLIPAAIRTRLYVDLSDPDWKERIVAAAEKRSPLIRETELNPYSVTIHAAPQPFKVLFEVRPRAGVWHPFAAGVPNGEKERVGFTFRSGARGFIPAIAGIHISGGNVISDDGAWYLELGHEAASPTQSYFLFCKEIPSALAFGQINTPGQMYFWRAADNVS